MRKPGRQLKRMWKRLRGDRGVSLKQFVYSTTLPVAMTLAWLRNKGRVIGGES